MGVLLRTLGLAGILAVGFWVGYEVFSLSFWTDYTMATIAAVLSTIGMLVVIFATIDYCLMTSWGKPSAEYEAYRLSNEINSHIDKSV